jgi:hypothetical protein
VRTLFVRRRAVREPFNRHQAAWEAVAEAQKLADEVVELLSAEDPESCSRQLVLRPDTDNDGSGTVRKRECVREVGGVDPRAWTVIGGNAAALWLLM